MSSITNIDDAWNLTGVKSLDFLWVEAGDRVAGAKIGMASLLAVARATFGVRFKSCRSRAGIYCGEPCVYPNFDPSPLVCQP